MKIERELTIISGFMGFAIGVCSMMLVNINKDIKMSDKIDSIMRENINTCEDIIEWMNYDVENYADSTVFDMYIYNLEEMIEENRNLLYTPDGQEVYFEDYIY
jgi:hypothetical protein